MNKSKKVISSFLLALILFTSCSSSTMIMSNPANAKLYIDGEMVGQTPYKHTDMKIVGSTTSVKIEKEGYKTFITEFSKNEEADIGAIIGGLFVWIPFLWTLKYKSNHSYELIPITDGYDATPEVQEIQETQQSQTSVTSKADKLRELKQLLDEKIITTEEFEKEKAKILNAK